MAPNQGTLAEYLDYYIKQLPESDRVLAYLIYYEELEPAQIAQVLHINHKQVNQQIGNLKSKIKNYLANYLDST